MKKKPIKKILCGPTHHHACACREEMFREGLEIIEQLLPWVCSICQVIGAKKIYDRAQAFLDKSR